ncbi:MAG: N-acetylmuramoyl-L-alanine amidase family protein [Tumebacillaceae bacterium]
MKLPGKWLVAFFFSVVLLTVVHTPSAKADTLKKPIMLIDPGHGGVDGGTTNAECTLLEKDLNLTIAKQLVDVLRKDGIHVEMTREQDEDVTKYAPDNRGWGRHLRDMYGRVEVARQKDVTLIVSIHGNHGTTTSSGALVFYKANSPESYLLASDLQMCLNQMTGSFHVPMRGNFYIIQKPNVPSVLVEYGFLSNPGEVAKLLTPAYQQELVNTLADGIRFFLISYHEPR